MNVLLVEDDKGLRELLINILQDRGHLVTSADNGLDGLTIFKEVLRGTMDDEIKQILFNTTLGGGEKTKSQTIPEHFDLVILNYNMPLLKGTKVAKEILKINPKQKFFVESATPIDLLEYRFLNELGFLLRIIQKPFKEEVFIKIIQEYE
jgi:CheY-like chemotaxis protein